MAAKTEKIFQVTLKSWDNLAGPPSWVWAAAWGELLAIFLSFSSLLVTATRYFLSSSNFFAIGIILMMPILIYAGHDGDSGHHRAHHLHQDPKQLSPQVQPRAGSRLAPDVCKLDLARQLPLSRHHNLHYGKKRKIQNIQTANIETEKLVLLPASSPHTQCQ